MLEKIVNYPFAFVGKTRLIVVETGVFLWYINNEVLFAKGVLNYYYEDSDM